MRLLAVDLGDRRTGLAAGDEASRIVSPAGVIEVDRANAEDELLRCVRDTAHEYEADQVVLGLPLNMDDTEGPRAAIVRDFGEKLAKMSDRFSVVYHDERLTSFAAEQHLNRSGKTHKQKKGLRDQLAAVEILKDYLRR